MSGPTDHERGMRMLWERLESLMAGKERPPRLRPPATEAAISTAEATMELAFPPDFRASLLVHDGQEDGEDDLDTLQWLPNQAPLAPLDRIVDQWHQHCKTYVQFHAGEEPQLIEDGRLYHYFWHPKRIPIAGNPWFDQDNVYIDHLPGPNGVAGQLAMTVDGLHTLPSAFDVKTTMDRIEAAVRARGLEVFVRIDPVRGG